MLHTLVFALFPEETAQRLKEVAGEVLGAGCLDGVL
jgi:hypothetical protein